MSLPRGKLVGGPFCGEQLSPASRAEFVWVQLLEGGARAYRKPSAKRELYRSLGIDSITKVEDFLFAGHTHRLCGGCGVVNEIAEGERAPRCQLCAFSLSHP